MAGLIKEENDVDLQAQIEEVEALSSIYGDEWCVIDEASRIFCIKISSDLEEPELTACLQIILPSDYPSAAPPIYQINAAWLRGPERVKLANSLEDIYVEHAGESILYLWVERVREFLVDKSQSSGTEEHLEKEITTAEEGVDDDDEEEEVPDFLALKLNTEAEYHFMDQGYDEELPAIKHGTTVTDRRSTFQPHLAAVVSARQVKMVLEKLYTNKKIASATHNIYAYSLLGRLTEVWLPVRASDQHRDIQTHAHTSGATPEARRIKCLAQGYNDSWLEGPGTEPPILPLLADLLNHVGPAACCCQELRLTVTVRDPRQGASLSETKVTCCS